MLYGDMFSLSIHPYPDCTIASGMLVMKFVRVVKLPIMPRDYTEHTWRSIREYYPIQQ